MENMDEVEGTKPVDVDGAKVESSTAPDDGTPNNIKPKVSPEFKENGREGGKGNFRRGGKFGNRGENRNYGGRRNFSGPNESTDREQTGNARRDYSGPREQGPSRDYGDRRDRDHGGNRDGQNAWNSSDYYREKLYEISGPTHELPPLDMSEKKFNGRNRLYVGNISSEMTDEAITKIFTEYGEVSDVFVNRDKFFAFVVFDYRSNAERAKHTLDGQMINSDRPLRIRFSPKAATIKVTNLPPTVTNELLYHSFSVFGEIERAIVLIDERGRSTGTGEIDFTRKKSATQAVKECTEGCFFLTNSLRPCIAELYEPVEDTDGYGESKIQWRNPEFLKDREVGPWLAKRDSFEFEFGMKWKQVRELYKQKEEALKKEMLIEEEKMYAQMGFVKYEYETMMLKKQLEEREMYWEQQKLELEKKERMADELKLRNEEDLRRREEQIKARLVRQDEEMKMRQKEKHFPQDRQDMRHYDDRQQQQQQQQQEEWRDGGYWQREAPQADDVASQGSRSRNTFLEEPGQVWKRLDEEGLGGDELFQRRPTQDVPLGEEYGGQAQWKRSWNEDYHFGKRGRY